MIEMTFLKVFLILTVSTAIYADGNDGLYSLLSPDQHEHTPRLEDFFWTGSGDGPPPPEELPLPTPPEPSRTLVRTTTVLATVYLDSYPPQAVTDKTTGECVTNCGDTVPGSLEPEVPDDRRYWLLTVIQGSTPDSLQVKLAKLYQKAFLRQQERHLGIIKSLDAPTARKKHDVHSFAVNTDNNIIESSYSNVPDFNAQTVVKENFSPSLILNNDTEIFLANVEDENDTSDNLVDMKDVETWVLVTPTAVLHKREVTQIEFAIEAKEMEDAAMDLEVGNDSLIIKREIIKPEQQPPVRVHIQNITESTETGSVHIVYVVTVGGRAVPAAVAARDMRLVRDAEVARELGAVVTTKAEPAYLKAAEGLAGEQAPPSGIHGVELWALVVGATVAVILLVLLVALMCRLAGKKKSMSAASVRAYRDELIREVERNRLKQVHEEKDGKLISVVSPSRTRFSSSILPVYRAASSVSSSSMSSSVSEITAATFRRRNKKSTAFRMPQKKRVGTTDSLLEAAGVDSSDSAKEASAPATPTSYLSMPSVRSFPRGNLVEPLSKVLEPISVRHLDVDSPPSTPAKPAPPRIVHETLKDSVPRRQMASQLVRLGSIDKDPGVVGPLVWDLHCQRMKDDSKSPAPSRADPSVSRMRRRFNELMDDAKNMFGSPRSSPINSAGTYNVDRDEASLAQARNDNVRVPIPGSPRPCSPHSELHTLRGRPATGRPSSVHISTTDMSRPRTSLTKPAAERRAPLRAWDITQSSSTTPRLPPVPIVNPSYILAEGRLPPSDPALPLISAIKSEIQKVREHAQSQRPSLDK